MIRHLLKKIFRTKKISPPEPIIELVKDPDIVQKVKKPRKPRAKKSKKL